MSLKPAGPIPGAAHRVLSKHWHGAVRHGPDAGKESTTMSFSRTAGTPAGSLRRSHGTSRSSPR